MQCEKCLAEPPRPAVDKLFKRRRGFLDQDSPLLREIFREWRTLSFGPLTPLEGSALDPVAPVRIGVRWPTAPDWWRDCEAIGLGVLEYEVGEGKSVWRPLDEGIRYFLSA
jgi:hypothetical protein